MSHTFMRMLFTTMCTIMAVTGAAASDTGQKTNFVFFLVDGPGWADIGCNDSTFHEAPNIDALAKSGVRFTIADAACPDCSPTRAGFMTVRHPVRVDITDWCPRA